jgi:molybdenum cofactor cytidylyltransferase
VEFGSVSLDRALGAIAVHSVRLASGLIRKGTVLGNAEIERIRVEGHHSVVVARLEPGDVQEDVAAERLARAVAGEGVRVERPFTGRSNLYSEVAGVLVVRRALIDGMNAVDESITVATLPEWRAVVPGEMIGTVKIIPFAVAGDLLDGALKEAERADAQPLGAAVSVAAFQPMRVGVVSTLLPGLKPSVVKKTVNVLAERLSIAGATMTADVQTPHETDALADAIAAMARGPAEMIVVFGASAITDRRDVIPAAIEQAGGRVEHFGMPVDPGNLLLLGHVGEKWILGAPGCARSPKENGFDWILQRLLAGLPVTGRDIAALGVGGLLMEIVQRGQLRDGLPGETGGETDSAQDDEGAGE